MPENLRTSLGVFSFSIFSQTIFLLRLFSSYILKLLKFCCRKTKKIFTSNLRKLVDFQMLNNSFGSWLIFFGKTYQPNYFTSIKMEEQISHKAIDENSLFAKSN
jgi:hypothetical protein